MRDKSKSRRHNLCNLQLLRSSAAAADAGFSSAFAEPKRELSSASEEEEEATRRRFDCAQSARMLNRLRVRCPRCRGVVVVVGSSGGSGGGGGDRVHGLPFSTHGSQSQSCVHAACAGSQSCTNSSHCTQHNTTHITFTFTPTTHT